MNEIFVPSLLISLGPSGRKALEFSKELLSYIPKHFLDVIDYYIIEGVEGISQHIQEIVDSKLLSLKNLNKLLDLGYKVRNDNVSSVRINIYLLWDVYNCEYSAYEVVKTLLELNYGNLDKDMHCGMALYIIPIMEREWVLEEAERRDSMDKLKSVIDFISEKENILYLDSKVYVLHCVSSDGTRIPLEEIQYIGGLLVFLNIIPSENPPLSHYKRRMLMEEGKYKIGTIGINALMILKHKLLDEYSKYLASDILKYASEHEEDESYEGYLSYHFINHSSHKKILCDGINISKKGSFFYLNSTDKFDEILGKDAINYPKTFLDLDQFLMDHYLPNMKETVDKNSEGYLSELKDNIDKDIRRIGLNISLKEILKYLSSIKEKLTEYPSTINAKVMVDTEDLNARLVEKVNKVPNLVGFIIKSAILTVFILYSMINLVFSTAFSIPKILLVALVFAALFTFLYIDYFYVRKQLKSFMEMYKKEILKKYGELINHYIEEKVAENCTIIEKYLDEKIAFIEVSIEICRKISEEVKPTIENEAEGYGTLIENLLNWQDRHNFYLESSPRAIDVYRKFTTELGGLETFQNKNLEEKILDFSNKVTATLIDLDFFKYLKFKYKEKSIEELCRWLEKGIIKSKYLLQYVNNDLLEEYSLFIGSPEVNRIIRDMDIKDIADFEVSILEEKNHFINSISLIRLCLGVDFENIVPVKRAKKGDKNA